MKKSFNLFLCAGAIAFSACNKTEKTESDTAVVIENDGTTSGRADTEAMYRDRAEKVTRRMASDLQYDNDTAFQSRARTVYITRANRLDEVRNRYTADTTGMYMELRKVDLETDNEFKTILKPEQYSVYERNRTTYYGGFDSDEMMDDNATASGSESRKDILGPGTTIKTKTEKDGDTKTEIEGPEGEIKIKRDADGETKIKTDRK